MYVYQDQPRMQMMAPPQQQQVLLPRRERMGHRRPGTGRTTPNKTSFGGQMPAGPLSQGMAAVPGYGAQMQLASARREMFERRPGTGRSTTPRRFDGIQGSAMKNPHGRLASAMKSGGGAADRSFGGEYVNGSYRPQPQPQQQQHMGYAPQPQMQPMYQQQQPAVYQQPVQQMQPMYAPAPQMQAVYAPAPVQYVQQQPEPVQQYREEPSQYAAEASYRAADSSTVLRQQPARSMKRKAGTGRVTARGGFNFKISASSREAARRNVAHKHAEQSALAHSEMQAQQSVMAAHVASQLPYQSDTSAEYSDGESMTMAIRAPPGAADGQHRSRRTHRRHRDDNEEAIRVPPQQHERERAGRHQREEHYPSVGQTESPTPRGGYDSEPENVDFGNDGADLSASAADESSIVESEAETEHETTVDPDEVAERLRLEEEEAKAWARNPADEIAEMEKKQRQEENAAAAEASFDMDGGDMGGMDDMDMGDQADLSEEEDDVAQQERPTKKSKKSKEQAAKKKTKMTKYEHVKVEQPQAYVITPPAEPEEGDQTPGCRRSRRRKMSPLAWWKGESVQYNRRMSAACIEVKAIRKCPDALTPYKRRRVEVDDGPLAICDRTVDSEASP